jgi:2-methylcitrate dehydratase
MTLVQNLAKFATDADYSKLSDDTRLALKIRVLDSLGCAIGAINSDLSRMLRRHVSEFDGANHCGLIGGGRCAPDRAAFYNSALVRYLDFNDSYLAPKETCHPSDNLGAVLAACEYAGQDGKTLLCALATAYQIQCRLSDEAPVRHKGFDHVTQLAYAVAGGVARALELNETQTANALAISGTAFNALRVTRTGALSHWKGLAAPNTAFCATHAAFLARQGITGPMQVFEGNKGFMDAISGLFTIDWSEENLEVVRQTIVKKYNAEIHSQSAIEGLLELQAQHQFTPSEIEYINVEIFAVAYNIIGGGEEGDKTHIHTKEEADHSLPYLLAVALLDGKIMPEQYSIDRIARRDVQDLLRKIRIQPNKDFSQRFPVEMPCRISVQLLNGKHLEIEKADYEGFKTNPMTWDRAVEKFDRLTRFLLSRSLIKAITQAVNDIEIISIKELMQILERVPVQEVQP